LLCLNFVRSACSLGTPDPCGVHTPLRCGAWGSSAKAGRQDSLCVGASVAGEGQLAKSGRRLAAGQLFSAPARPTKPDNRSSPFSACAGGSSVMALGRLSALRRSDLSREVRVRSLHIYDVHPSLSLGRAFRRPLADCDRTLLGVQTVHLRVVGAAALAVSRRKSAAETGQKPPDAQPAAGAASTSSYHLPRARCNLGLPLGASALPMRCGGRLSLCARQMKHAVAL